MRQQYTECWIRCLIASHGAGHGSTGWSACQVVAAVWSALNYFADPV